MILLDGKRLRDITAEVLKREVYSTMQEVASAMPQLAILQIGDLLESNAFIKQKKLFAEKIGVAVNHIVYPAKISEDNLIEDIKRLNKTEDVHGIILQLPIPEKLNKQKIINAINPKKDVDGLTATNIEKLWTNDTTAILPATTVGIISILKHFEIPIDGKKVVVVGRSMLVGKPIAHALLRENATVTICHRHTENLAAETMQADILVVAAGSPKLITKDFVKKGQIIIDVGINFVDEETLPKPENEIPKKKMVGDVDLENVKDIVGAITPVPGGVGPMTVASLFQNLVKTWREQSI